ncbi:proteasome non-ATPase 26S subunit-domain-containing protein [Parasitella parasitica]|nr:proteasome non-ATPase 26S subunit-domain-containing protein [Parasitella parasitica]
MSPAPSNTLERVSQVLQPNVNVPINEKIAVLQAFAASLTESLSLEKSAEILQVAPLGLFYYGFSAEDDQLTSVLCELINKILHPYSYDQIVSAENKAMFKCLVSDAFVSNMVDSEIFPLVVATIAFQDARTANKASELLCKISAMPSGQAAFFSPTCTAMLKQLLQINGVISFRVYDLIIKVAAYSDSTFEACDSTGLLSVFIKELQSDDLLVKINAIELLNEIATTSAGLSFLEKANLLGTITTILDNPDDSDVVVQLIVAISTIGLVGSHPAGLKLLSDTLLTTFFSRYETAVGQVKAVYLQSISKMISVRYRVIPSSPPPFFFIVVMLEMVQNSIIKEAKQPEDSIRVASFAVMQAIAYHAWGVQNWKYAIIQTLVSAPDASRVLNEYHAQLQLYVRQGAHFKMLEPAAAVESS